MGESMGAKEFVGAVQRIMQAQVLNKQRVDGEAGEHVKNTSKFVFQLLEEDINTQAFYKGRQLSSQESNALTATVVGAMHHFFSVPQEREVIKNGRLVEEVRGRVDHARSALVLLVPFPDPFFVGEVLAKIASVNGCYFSTIRTVAEDSRDYFETLRKEYPAEMKTVEEFLRSVDPRIIEKSAFAIFFSQKDLYKKVLKDDKVSKEEKVLIRALVDIHTTNPRINVSQLPYELEVLNEKVVDLPNY